MTLLSRSQVNVEQVTSYDILISVQKSWKIATVDYQLWDLRPEVTYLSTVSYELLMSSIHVNISTGNREYLEPQIRSMNNRFHSEAKLPWSYNYPLANHIAINKSSANREMPLFRAFALLSGIFKIFPPRGLKYSLLRVYYSNLVWLFKKLLSFTLWLLTWLLGQPGSWQNGLSFFLWLP